MDVAEVGYVRPKVQTSHDFYMCEILTTSRFPAQLRRQLLRSQAVELHSKATSKQRL